MERFFNTKTLEEIITGCEAAGIPFSPVARPEDLFEDPQLNEGGSLDMARLPDGRFAKLPRLPLGFDGERLNLRLEAPEIGEHSQAILAELGYNEEEVASFEAAEVVVVGN